MRFTQAAVLGLPAFAAAFPGMGGMGSRSEMEAAIRAAAEREAAEKRAAEPQLDPLGNLAGGLGDLVGGLLGSVGEALVKEDNKRPEPGYPFIAPGPNDSRGPCPGLNTLANHGYLPRDGYVNMGQVIKAVGHGFNMGADLATVLVVFQVLSSGDLDTLAFYLGASKNGIGGLNRHSTVEADISPLQEDYYNGCGDNHHISSRLVKDIVKLVAQDPKKEFSIDVMAKQYSAHADFSKKYNPYLYYFPFPQIVSVVAFNFFPRFFANGTSEKGGIANYESVAAINGIQYDPKSGEFMHVPERFPDNWYRRDFPYGAVEALTEGFTMIYPRNIVVPAVAQIGTDNLSVQTFLCDLYQGLNSINPLVLGRGFEDGSKALTWALSVLDPILGKTALGCPDNVISPNMLYPEPTREGGPANPPYIPSDKWTGNNVYNKVYFKEAPTGVACDH